MDIACNVGGRDVWFWICVQVSNDGYNFWNQQGTCGWRLGSWGPTTYTSATANWGCIGSNPWHYRTAGYSEKKWPDGQVTYSPWKFSYSLFAYC